MNRREFTVEAALLLLGGATIVISGCGGGAASSPTTSTAPPLTDATGAIAANHGHAAVITAAQLGDGGSLDLDIRGTSSHTHTVSLSATDIANVRRGTQVQRESSGTSHTHVVTFNAPA
jgi:hypothetical protein